MKTLQIAKMVSIYLVGSILIRLYIIIIEKINMEGFDTLTVTLLIAWTIYTGIKLTRKILQKKLIQQYGT